MTAARTSEHATDRPTTTTATGPTPAGASQRPGQRAYTALIGLAALAVLLQGLWAGLFVHEGEDYQQSWVDVHARGAEVAIALAAAATVLAWVRLRDRRDLLIGSAAMTVLLVLEAYLGGLVGDSPALTALHFPLAMALMGLAVWLPVRAVRRRR
ncbi:MAG TPA: hypothetical protein VIG48_07575 [Jatrophihabitans sp.]|jgi:hypothetical protein